MTSNFDRRKHITELQNACARFYHPGPVQTDEDDFDSLFLPLKREFPARNCWQSPWERLFDFFAIGLFITDVTLHTLIILQFYESQYMTCFWASIAWFVVLQVVASDMFVHIFVSKEKKLYGFWFIFPFAQFVPLIIFAHSLHWRWLDSLLRRLGPSRRPALNFAEEDDPWERFVKVKKEQHMGFLMEAFMQGLPGILLVTALLASDDMAASPLAVASLLVSLVTLASQGGVLFAYSIDRWTRIFVSWGFMVDAFSLFATVVWLCCPFEGHLPVLFWGRSWWLCKEKVFMALWCCVCMVFGVLAAFKQKLWKKKLKTCAMFVLCLVLFVPATVLLEGSKFWLLGMLMSNHSEPSKRCFLGKRNHDLFTWIFWFLDTTHTINGVEVDPGFMEKHRLINRTIVKMMKNKMDVTTHSRLLELTANKSSYSFSALREANHFRDRVKDFVFTTWKRGRGEKLISYCWRLLWLFCLLPCLVLSSLLSLAFPFVMFCSVPFEDMPLLQRVASFAYFGSLLVWLLLGIKVLRFLWVRLHLVKLAGLWHLDATYRFQEYLTHGFNTLRGRTLLQSDIVLPLPSVLSGLVADYAFDENYRVICMRD